MAITLLDLRTQARQRADQEHSQLVSDSELTRYINEGYAELYDLLVAKFEDYYVLPPVAFTISGSTSDNTKCRYALPADFYKLRGLDMAVDGGTATNAQFWIALKPFTFNNRNRFGVIRRRTLMPVVRYRIYGNSLYFEPENVCDGTYRMFYTPTLTLLTADTDPANVGNGWEQYIVLDAAIKMLQKEESDPTIFIQQKMDMRQRIEDMAANRDEGENERISDTVYDYDDEFYLTNWR